MNDHLVRVLLVEDNSDYAWMLRLVLTQIYPDQFELTQVDTLADAMTHLDGTPCDVILLDLSLPDSTGYETFLQTRHRAPDVPIVVMTAMDDKELALQSVREGAQDFLVKGDMDIIQLVRSIQYAVERYRNLADLKRQSLIDDLTGLLNRRGFLSLGAQHIKIAERSHRNMLLFYADLDGLKQINDRLGHQVGDEALKSIAAILRETFRSSDLIARLGGDEFTVLAIDAPDSTTGAILGRLQQKISQHNRQSSTYQLSLSVGTARFDPQQTPDINTLMSLADKALYESKDSKSSIASKAV